MAERTLLLVNKFYHDRGPAGGVGRYLLQEEEDMAKAGWRVVPFAIQDDLARFSVWSEHFVRARDYSRPRWSLSAAGDALSLLWNREAARKLDRLVRQIRPSVAHLHNIYHHLSPSVLSVLARHAVPIVMTLHDLRLLCPAIHMLRHGELCERCRGGRFFEAVRGRCVKNSRAASALAALETAHQHYRALYRRQVTLFICPSLFIREKFTRWGYLPSKLIHLPNFVDTDQWQPSPLPSTNAYLYFGRISPEKGLATLLEAHSFLEGEIGTAAPPPTLMIAGTGPWDNELKRRVSELDLQHVQLLGNLSGDELYAAVARARFTAIPSECYENAPMALLESLAAGRPVVGSRLGGIQELIEDGRDGILCEPGDARDLLRGLRRALDLGPEAGQRARQKAVAMASRPIHMQRLQEILNSVAIPAD